MREAVSLRDAVFWMNFHLELLGAHQRALRRMRALIANSRRPDDCAADAQLVGAEIERELDRLRYWEEMVDRSDRAVRLRPILAAFGPRT